MKKRKQVTQTSQRSAQLEQIEKSNDAYGAFKVLRLLVHFIAAAQFIYGIYYQWFNVNWPQSEYNEEELKARWGGKFKFLTFLDVILQAIYHTIALLNDLFGSNDILEDSTKLPALRRVKDYMFAAWAFPIAHNVCISFWVIYIYDRELIFPAVLDAIFPNWLNHIVHTNVAMMCIMDLFTCFRRYPSRFAGLSGTIIFMTLYLIWLHIVRYFSGQWVYPLLEVLNFPMRYVMLSALMGFTIICYLLGEAVNNIIWAPELNLITAKSKRK